MKRRLWTWGTRLLGLLLVGLVLWLVGWMDRVRDPHGEVHRGRVLRVKEDHAVLRVDGTERRVPIRGPDDVDRGLGGVFARFLERPGPALLALLAFLLSLAAMQVRWLVFLGGAGLSTPVAEVFRLGWIGLFWNQVLPAGQVGGDLVKAFLIARAHPLRKPLAVVSVLAERGIGLFVLSAVAAGGALLAPPGAEMGVARVVAVVSFLVCLVFLLALMAPWLRGRLGLARGLARLPLGGLWREVARAFDLYGRRPRVIAAGIGAGLLVHALYLAGFFFLGRAFHVDLGWIALLVAIPVAQMAGSLPGLPAGWGVGDMAFYFLLPAAGVAASTAVALSFTFRAFVMLLSLPGGLLLARRPRIERVAVARELR